MAPSLVLRDTVCPMHPWDMTASTKGGVYQAAAGADPKQRGQQVTVLLLVTSIRFSFVALPVSTPHGTGPFVG